MTTYAGLCACGRPRPDDCSECQWCEELTDLETENERLLDLVAHWRRVSALHLRTLFIFAALLAAALFYIGVRG